MKNIFYLFALLLIFNNTTNSQTSTDTIEVTAGWNLIGALETGATLEILNTEPPGIIEGSIFGYVPGTGYNQADTLNRGKGYWVKVNQNGLIIIILAAPQPPTLLSPPNGATSVSLPPTLNWNESSSTTSYTLQVATSDQFTTLIYNC